jgi:mannan endo-1,4-beta-mannosidase
MKKHIKLSQLSIIFLLFIIFLAGCSKSKSDIAPPPVVPPTDTIVAPPPAAVSVFGNGVNLQPSYYNNGNPDFGWSLMKTQSKIKTVRIEIEPGYVTQATGWISGAIANGYTVIATYHKYKVLGSDDAAELTAAANWWKTNYATLSAAGPIIINLMNEWGSHNITADAYATAYNNAIAIVRTVYSGNIIIDIPGYGQETATAACAVKGCNAGQTKITDPKIILSAHIYPGGYNQAKGRYMIKTDLDDLASANRTCIIGEFGNDGGSGADWSGIVDYASTKKWAILAWAWNGDGGTMNMVSPPWVTNSSATAFTLSPYFNIVYTKL